MYPHARAILWAQVRILRNSYPRGSRTRLLLTAILAVFWYGMWALGGVAAAVILAQMEDREKLGEILATGLMASLLYWQIIPILMVSAGAALDFKRLRVYPVPDSQLFGLEVMLRLTTAVEMLLILAGATVGLILNPLLPVWSVAGLLPFALMNLLLSAGLRNLLERILSRRYIREFALLALVSLVALPQVLMISGATESARRFVTFPHHAWWPWSAGAATIMGEGALTPWLTLAGWTLIAYAFGRWQFGRSLQFDKEAADVRATEAGWASMLFDRLARLPSLALRDPVSVIVEKEIRSMSRSPRFRVVFVMGFTFGLLIWLPIAVQGRLDGGSFFTTNYLTFVSLYALLLLGEVSFWNSFGFDRSATQIYFLTGLPAARVLIGKNIAALVFVMLEISAVAAACFALRMPITAPKLIEAYLVTFTLALYMLAAGNIGSTRFPRPVNPRQSWRSTSASRFQAMLVLIYPVIAMPVGLAFLARYVTGSLIAFYAALVFAALLGMIIYRFALAGAVQRMERNQEQMLSVLSAGEGPVST